MWGPSRPETSEPPPKITDLLTNFVTAYLGFSFALQNNTTNLLFNLQAFSI